jgi:hypothetical protein
MAIWMTALKIIPWGQVLESAPHIVKAARHLFTASKTGASGSGEAASRQDNEGAAGFHSPNQRVRLLEKKLADLSNEQKATAELIKSLAEQNVVMVEAIEVFRVRVKILLFACILLFGTMIALILWLATHAG